MFGFGAQDANPSVRIERQQLPHALRTSTRTKRDLQRFFDQRLEKRSVWQPRGVVKCHLNSEVHARGTDLTAPDGPSRLCRLQGVSGLRVHSRNLALPSRAQILLVTWRSPWVLRPWWKVDDLALAQPSVSVRTSAAWCTSANTEQPCQRVSQPCRKTRACTLIEDGFNMCWASGPARMSGGEMTNRKKIENLVEY